MSYCKREFTSFFTFYIQGDFMAVTKRKGNYKGGIAKHYTEYSNFEVCHSDWKYKRITKTKMAEYLNVSRPTLDKLIKQYQEHRKYRY